MILKWLIPKLRSLKMGQTILDIGPRWHKSKEGTPTMGGLSFLVAMSLVILTVGIAAVI
ncbi:MAG: phospho-N-acetylmuramoyl-pentapeptide-transferase, partial [Clostridia bacterium]|nr:phospho-N-acetylmuramoyl-pentapeptide-transferase [Clostridia bacterium]